MFARGRDFRRGQGDQGRVARRAAGGFHEGSHQVYESIA